MYYQTKYKDATIRNSTVALLYNFINNIAEMNMQ